MRGEPSVLVIVDVGWRRFPPVEPPLPVTMRMEQIFEAQALTEVVDAVGQLGPQGNARRKSLDAQHHGGHGAKHGAR